MIPSREYRKILNENRETLISCYHRSRSNLDRPDEPVDLLIDSIGIEKAAEIVSAMILKKGKWDARISPVNRNWASEVCDFTDEELVGFWYCDEIHPAHFDQIADCLRRKMREEKVSE